MKKTYCKKRTTPGNGIVTVFLSALFLGCLTLLPTAHSDAGEFYMVKPLPAARQSAIAASRESHVVRAANVEVVRDFFEICKSVEVSDSLLMTFFEAAPDAPAKTFKARIASRHEGVADKTTILSASLQGCVLQTVLITTNPEHVIITLQDMDTGLIYRMFGSPRTGVGEVVKIDLSKRPPAYCLPPVIPPTR